MAQSSQAKEVILEIGEEIGLQEYSIQVQNGTVKKFIFDNCSAPQDCSTDVLNANSGLVNNWNGWYGLACTDVRQIGNAPSIQPITGSSYYFPISPGANFNINYAYDSGYNSENTEGNAIIFTLQRSGGGSPDFNGCEFSVNSTQGVWYAQNLKSEGRENTEQGRMLYLVPKSGAGITTRISFEILEGNRDKLMVRGSGGKSIGEFLHNNGFSQFPIQTINSPSWWQMFDFYVSPYVHGGNWYYDSDGHVNYDDSIQTVHASYVETPNGVPNFASMVLETNTFGLRSTDDIFNCFEGYTHGYELAITIDSMTNCRVEVLTYTDDNGFDFAFDYAGVGHSGQNFVWEKINTTGSHTVCVPFHYNVATTEELQSPNAYGNTGGWSTAIEVQTGGGGYLSGQVAYKKFYKAQYRFIRVVKINESLPASLEISRFEVKSSSHSVRSIDVPTYITQKIEVPAYDYEVLDVYDRDKVPLALTFNSGDLRDPSKRSTGYSKTFELPASIRNQQFLKTMTADGSERQAEDISWRKARISANGVVVFNGFARIEKSTTGQGGKYSCHILQDPSYWPELIGDKKLCDLSFDSHIKNYNNVVNSWSDNVDNIPYVYPAINYGEWSKDIIGVDKHSLNDFHPAAYVKAIVDKIFDDIGYDVKSDFMDGAMFKKLIIPFTGDPDDYKSQADPLGEDGDYSATASLAAEYGLPYIPATGFNNTHINRYYRPVIPCQNGCAYYTPGSSNSIQNGYTVPFTGRYNVHYQAEMRLKAPGICGNGNPGRWAAWLFVNGLSVGPYSHGYPNSGNDQFTYDELNQSINQFDVDGAPSCAWFENQSNGDWIPNSFDTSIELQQGDEVQIGFFGVNYKDICGFEADIRDQDFGIWPDVSQAFAPPQEISFSDSLDCSLKQVDFLKGITQLFNLYWTADNDLKEVYVEPYDAFYGSGEVVDWTKKIDRKSWTDKFLIDELAKNITYKYKVDSADDLVEIYNESMDTELWSTIITNEELYRKEDKELGTTVFSPTFRIKTGGGGDATFVNSGQWPVMPCMWSGDPVYWGWFNGPSRPDNSTKFNIRILNYHGLSSEVGSWKLTDDNGNEQTHNQYPYAYTYNYNHAGAGAIEDNLAWYDIGAGATYQRGLFDRFYGRLYEKVSGGAALRTCMMDLTQADISHFDFRDVIRIDMDGGVPTYWTVHKIIDYKPGKDVLTKVELVEWKYGFDAFGKPNKLNATNYGFLPDNGGKPAGGKGSITGPNGDFVVHSNGDTFLPDDSIVLSTSVKAKSNLTVDILKSVPKLPNFKTKFNDRALEINNDNGVTNNPAIYDPAQANNVKRNAVAFGSGLEANGSQVVLGKYNSPNASDTFQVGAGYVDSITGKFERLNAISISKNGEFCIYGGEVVADFKTGDVTLTGDVYYTDNDGRKKKVYLKEKIENNY